MRFSCLPGGAVVSGPARPAAGFRYSLDAGRAVALAGQPLARERRVTAAVTARPYGPPRAIVHTVLERAGQAGLPFNDAWALAVPLALARAESRDAAAELARGFERERPDWRADYGHSAGVR